MDIRRFETEYGGKKVIIESGRLAGQADAAVTAQIGDTVVLATVQMAKPFAPDLEFFPLMVDYEERYYAAGQIKGPRYQKREGRPPAEAVLISRMIDRGLRPLFLDNLRNDIQIILTIYLVTNNRGNLFWMFDHIEFIISPRRTFQHHHA